MSRYDLEIAALLHNIEVLWQRARLTLDPALFPRPELASGDLARLELAQRLSSGRANGGAHSGAEPIPLQSIFASVSLENAGPLSYLPVGPQKMIAPPYPASAPEARETLSQGYSRLCTALTQEARRLEPVRKAHPLAYLEGLFLSLQRYAAGIPVSADAQDISLFDHNHSVAALCTCLRELPDAEVERLLALDSALFAQDTTLAVLVGGDISGVQDFIYGIRDAGGAAQNLRGRSLYLQLLTEAAQRYVLRRLGLPITSVLYSGGAHFFLVSPAGVAAANVGALRRELSEVLLAFHGRALYLALGGAEVRASDFREGAMPARWTALHTDLGAAKSQRYAELDEEVRYASIFSPCEPVSDVADDLYEGLGKRFPHTTHLVLDIIEPGVAETALEALGLRVQLAGTNLPVQSTEDAEYRLRLALSDVPLSAEAVSADVPIVDGVRYTLNRVPDLTFDDLAQFPMFVDASGHEHGIQRLGILRMDVDNLGRVFREGLGQRATLARIATLSRTLATFFEGRVAALCQATDEAAGAAALYGVYAGGDDLFLVGPWHWMPSLARTICTEFRQLTGGHADLHLSAGIALVTQKYPLYQAAEDAREALDEGAKAGGKNAISFLGEVLPWQSQDGRGFEEVQRWATAFIDAGIQHGNRFPISLLGRLIELDEMRRKETKHGAQSNLGRWVWTGVYQLHRLGEQYVRTDPAIAQVIREVLVALQNDHFANLPVLAFAARWAHLALRRSQVE